VRRHRLLVALLKNALVLGLLHDVAHAADAESHSGEVHTVIALLIASAQPQSSVLNEVLDSAKLAVEASPVKRGLTLEIPTVNVSTALDKESEKLDETIGSSSH